MTVQDLNNLFGKNVKYYRKKKKLTLKKLAEKGGIHFNALLRYEHGFNFPQPAKLLALCNIFCIEPWQLFYQEKNHRCKEIKP